jgi:hypothetical protein
MSGALAVLLGSILFGAVKGSVQEPGQSDPKYRITPTKSSQFETGVYIPKDLVDAFKELDRMLTPEFRREFGRLKESEVARHHFDLGGWLRNQWGLWKGLRLAKWFNEKGIHHPDDMSGIILDSYWRKLNKRPIGLEAQIKSYKAYWQEQREASNREQARLAKAKTRIKGMIAGLVYDVGNPAAVKFSASGFSGIRVRYAAPFEAGIVVAAKVNDPAKGRFDTRSFFVDVGNRRMHPIKVPEFKQVLDSVVVGGKLYVHGASGTKQGVVEIGGSKRSELAAPAVVPFRLGIDREKSHLLAVGKNWVRRWSAGKWTMVQVGVKTLPDSVAPPEITDGRLYIQSEGVHETDKRLWWVDLANKRLESFDAHVGVIGTDGPRWESVWNHVLDSQKRLWISTGLVSTSVLTWTSRQGYRILLYNDGTTFMDDMFGTAEPPDRIGNHSLRITAFEPRLDGTMLAIGPSGIFELRGDSIRPTHWFNTGNTELHPTTS